MLSKLKLLFKNIKYLMQIDLEKVFNSQYKTFDAKTNILGTRISSIQRAIDDQFDISLDLHVGSSYNKETCHVIVSGIYRGNDFVKVYTVHPKEFQELVKHLNEREKYGNIRRADAYSRELQKEVKSHYKRGQRWKI